MHDRNLTSMYDSEDGRLFLQELSKPNETARIRHRSHKYSKLLAGLMSDERLRSTTTAVSTSTVAATTTPTLPSSSEYGDYVQLERNLPDSLSNLNGENTANAITCYSTNQVVFIIGITCFLNFAFIALIMIFVRCFGAPTSKYNRCEEDNLISDDEEENFCDKEGSEVDELNNWESSRLRLASLPDNIITQTVTERYMASKLGLGRQTCGGDNNYQELTYFSDNDGNVEEDSDRDSTHYSVYDYNRSENGADIYRRLKQKYCYSNLPCDDFTFHSANLSANK